MSLLCISIAHFSSVQSSDSGSIVSALCFFREARPLLPVFQYSVPSWAELQVVLGWSSRYVGLCRRLPSWLAHLDGSGRHDSGSESCLLYTSDAADERSSVDLGGRRIIKKKKH